MTLLEILSPESGMTLILAAYVALCFAVSVTAIVWVWRRTPKPLRIALFCATVLALLAVSNRMLEFADTRNMIAASNRGESITDWGER